MEQIYKEDILNFQEFVELRNKYNDTLMDKDFNWRMFRGSYKELMGIGTKTDCTLCNKIANELNIPIDELLLNDETCNYCMWSLERYTEIEPYCINDVWFGYMCDIKQTAENRVRRMDELIEAYYNLESKTQTKEVYVIVDAYVPACTGKKYIGDGNKNVELIENAIHFDSKQQAQDYIDEHEWDWATVSCETIILN